MKFSFSENFHVYSIYSTHFIMGGGGGILVTKYIIGSIFITTDCMQSTLNETELGDVRLSDGCTGELEIYSNPLNAEGWYRVCAASSGFSDRASQVVCKQLGCPVNGASSTFTRYTNINSILYYYEAL